MRPATEHEINIWDELVQANPDGGNPLQCRAFAETKAAFGWKPRYMVFEGDTDIAAVFLARRLPLLGELWYSPKGPGVAGLDQLKRCVKDLKKGSTAFAVKIEPDLPNATPAPDLKALGLNKAKDLQYNRYTVAVDIRRPEEELLADLKQKTRYNIRYAGRKGVSVEPVAATPENLQTMYGLMEATQDRAGFFLRDYEYFSTFWQKHAEAGRGQLFFARYEGEVIAGAFVTFLGKKGLYKDGGSVRKHSNVQAPYLLQWEVMCWLRSQGVEEYDLHGTPPADEADNQDHPLYGLARFKTSFGDIVEFIGTYDLPLDRQRYRLWQKIGERLATGYWHRVKKRLFY